MFFFIGNLSFKILLIIKIGILIFILLFEFRIIFLEFYGSFYFLGLYLRLIDWGIVIEIFLRNFI